MKTFVTLALAVIFIASSTWGEVRKPSVSKSPMDPDQLAVYRLFLRKYEKGNTARLNLSDLTSTFSPNDARCMQGIEFDPVGSYRSVIHRFDPRTTFPGNVQLVDPSQQQEAVRQNDPGPTGHQGKDVSTAVEAGFSAGFLRLSEVAFDKNHRYAAMSFSFVCGGLCGHGSTVVFEKKNGKWYELKRACSVWVS